jgi:hypothetical protein
MKNWSRVPDGHLTPRRTGRLIVGREVTSTSMARLNEAVKKITLNKKYKHVVVWFITISDGVSNF